MKSDKMIEPLVENEHLEFHHPKDIEAAGGLPQPGDMSRFVSDHKQPIGTSKPSNALIYWMILLVLMIIPFLIIVNVLLPYMVVDIDFNGQSNDLNILDPKNDGLDTKFIYYSMQRFVLPQENAVPKRKVRLVHDFNTNVTGIIDKTSERCFIKPLDRSIIKPPHSLFDLWQKMWQNVYSIDENDFRDLIVSFPKINVVDISPIIAEECENWPVYRLIKRDESTKPMYEEN